MKQLIDTLERDEYSNKYYYNKMLSDFEMESRHEDILRKKRNKWRAESLKYIERVQNMKEKKQEMYANKMNKLQKEIKDRIKRATDLEVKEVNIRVKNTVDVKPVENKTEKKV